MTDMCIVLRHSWTTCLADGRVSAVLSGSAWHHSHKCSLPVVECAGFQSNQTSPTNFTNQHVFNQTEKNKSAGVEFGLNWNLHIFQGAGLDPIGIEEAWQHTSVIHGVSLYNGSTECYIWCIKLISWLSPTTLMVLFDGRKLMSVC